MSAVTPRWSLESTLHRARVAYRLATKYQSFVEPRLSPGLLAQLLADRALLGDSNAQASLALTNQKTATSAERELAAEAHALIMQIREAVARSRNVPDDLRTNIGIGDGLRAIDTSKVIAGLDAVISSAVPLGSCGVLPQDILDATQLRDALHAADLKQNAARDLRSNLAESREDTQLRVQASVDEIAGRAPLAFRKDKLLQARFERVVSASGPTPEDDAEAGAEPAPTPA